MKPLLDVLSNRMPARRPIWLMRQAGRYLPEYREVRRSTKDFLDLCYTPELAAEVTFQPLQRYDLDAAIMFADILLVPDALGLPVSFQEGEGPVLEPVRDGKSLAKLGHTDIHEKLAPVYETVRLLAKGLPENVTLIGFAGAPWTVATYMVEGRGSPDQAAAKNWAYREPDEFQKLIDMLVDATVDYLTAQIDAGAEVLQLFDTWAGSLPATEFERWCIKPTAEIIRRVRAARDGIPIIGFPRGAGPSYIKYVETTGVDGVSLDTPMPLDWAVNNLQPRTVIQGNLDPLALVAGGNILREQTEGILEAFSGGRHIFNLGHGIVPQTPPDHVTELISLIRDHDA